MPPDHRIFSNLESLSIAAADDIVIQAHEAIEHRGSFHIALSGGSTPKCLYQTLASSAFSDRVDWNCVHIYFGDERYVPETHPDSNYAMVKKAMLDTLPIPGEQIHSIPTQLDDPETSAQAYSQYLYSSLPTDDGICLFDIVLLGIGPDGHIASLFPETRALDCTEPKALPVYVEKFDSWRISISFPLINNARSVMILAAGESKSHVVADVFSGRSKGYPVERVKPESGSLTWYLDRDACQLITHSDS